MRSQLVGNATHANLNDVQLGAVVDTAAAPSTFERHRGDRT